MAHSQKKVEQDKVSSAAQTYSQIYFSTPVKGSRSSSPEASQTSSQDQDLKEMFGRETDLEPDVIVTALEPYVIVTAHEYQSSEKLDKREGTASGDKGEQKGPKSPKVTVEHFSAASAYEAVSTELKAKIEVREGDATISSELVIFMEDVYGIENKDCILDKNEVVSTPVATIIMENLIEVIITNEDFIAAKDSVKERAEAAYNCLELFAAKKVKVTTGKDKPTVLSVNLFLDEARIQHQADLDKAEEAKTVEAEKSAPPKEAFKPSEKESKEIEKGAVLFLPTFFGVDASKATTFQKAQAKVFTAISEHNFKLYKHYRDELISSGSWMTFKRDTLLDFHALYGVTPYSFAELIIQKMLYAKSKTTNNSVNSSWLNEMGEIKADLQSRDTHIWHGTDAEALEICMKVIQGKMDVSYLLALLELMSTEVDLELEHTDSPDTLKVKDVVSGDLTAALVDKRNQHGENIFHIILKRVANAAEQSDPTVTAKTIQDCSFMINHLLHKVEATHALLNAADEHGVTPTHLVAELNVGDVFSQAMIAMFKNTKADMTVQDREGKTVLHRAIDSGVVGNVRAVLFHIEDQSEMVQVIGTDSVSTAEVHEMPVNVIDKNADQLVSIGTGRSSIEMHSHELYTADATPINEDDIDATHKARSVKFATERAEFQRSFKDDLGFFPYGLRVNTLSKLEPTQPTAMTTLQAAVASASIDILRMVTASVSVPGFDQVDSAGRTAIHYGAMAIPLQNAAKEVSKSMVIDEKEVPKSSKKSSKRSEAEAKAEAEAERVKAEVEAKAKSAFDSADDQHRALQKNTIKVMQTVIAGSHKNALSLRDGMGNTPAHYAVLSGDAEVLQVVVNTLMSPAPDQDTASVDLERMLMQKRTVAALRAADTKSGKIKIDVLKSILIGVNKTIVPVWTKDQQLWEQWDKLTQLTEDGSEVNSEDVVTIIRLIEKLLPDSEAAEGVARENAIKVLSTPNKNSDTPLHYLVKSLTSHEDLLALKKGNQTKELDYLRTRNYQINKMIDMLVNTVKVAFTPNNESMTALHIAAERGNAEAVKTISVTMLFRKPGMLHAKSSDNKKAFDSAFQIAARKGHAHVIDAFATAPYSMRDDVPVKLADAEVQYTGAYKNVLLNAELTDKARQATIIAIIKASGDKDRTEDSEKEFMSVNVTFNHQEDGKSGDIELSPLRLAVMGADLQSVHTLLSVGSADVHQADMDGLTAIHMAARGTGNATQHSPTQDRNILTTLLLHGADVVATKVPKIKIEDELADPVSSSSPNVGEEDSSSQSKSVVPNTNDPTYKASPLFIAVHNGNKAMAETLMVSMTHKQQDPDFIADGQEEKDKPSNIKPSQNLPGEVENNISLRKAVIANRQDIQSLFAVFASFGSVIEDTDEVEEVKFQAQIEEVKGEDEVDEVKFEAADETAGKSQIDAVAYRPKVDAVKFEAEVKAVAHKPAVACHLTGMLGNFEKFILKDDLKALQVFDAQLHQAKATLEAHGFSAHLVDELVFNVLTALNQNLEDYRGYRLNPEVESDIILNLTYLLTMDNPKILDLVAGSLLQKAISISKKKLSTSDEETAKQMQRDSLSLQFRAELVHQRAESLRVTLELDPQYAALVHDEEDEVVYLYHERGEHVAKEASNTHFGMDNVEMNGLMDAKHQQALLDNGDVVEAFQKSMDQKGTYLLNKGVMEAAKDITSGRMALHATSFAYVARQRGMSQPRQKALAILDNAMSMYNRSLKKKGLSYDGYNAANALKKVITKNQTEFNANPELLNDAFIQASLDFTSAHGTLSQGTLCEARLPEMFKPVLLKHEGEESSSDFQDVSARPMEDPFMEATQYFLATQFVKSGGVLLVMDRKVEEEAKDTESKDSGKDGSYSGDFGASMNFGGGS